MKEIKMIAHTLARTAVLGALLVPFGTASAASQYTITDLGVLPGGSASVATAINANGQIAGFSDVSGGDSHAFLYSAGTLSDLGTLPDGTYADAAALNDSGQVVGTADNIAGDDRAFIYSGGAMMSLGTLLGGTSSYAYGINIAGQIVGEGDITSGESRAFSYTNGVMTDLGTLGGSDSSAADINNSGQIVGYSRTVNDDVRAFIYSNGVMSDLLGVSSSASAINEPGQVTGLLAGPGGTGTHAFLYFNGLLTDLGTLGGAASYSDDINNFGAIVGTSDSANGRAAFLYEGGAMYDLNGLLVSNTGWDLRAATGINDSGQIVGYGFFNGEQRGFLLTPSAVPVPAAAWLFGSGLAGLAAFRRRKRREA
jgi:probable HAF family extracellular repeat protein